MKKILEKHIEIINTNELCKKIKLSGHIIMNTLEWNFYNGELSKKHVIDNLLPKNYVIITGNVSNTNHYGYIINGSEYTIIGGTTIDEMDIPDNFHPVLKLIIDNGKFIINICNDIYKN